MARLVLSALVMAALLAQGTHGWSLFRKTSEVSVDDFSTLEAYGPITGKTMLALRGAVLARAPPTSVAAAAEAANASGAIPNQPYATLAYGRNSTVTLQRNGPNSLSIFFFNDNELEPTAADWAASTKVPFLSDFVYTAEAPASLVQQYSTLTASRPGQAAGLLPAAVQQLMGAEAVLWVSCSGDGAAGGLAILCGVQSALLYPQAGVDVITFATPWAAGFNPQFAWAFDRLLSLYYLWPFSSGKEVETPTPATSAAAVFMSAAQQLAFALDSLIRAKGVLEGAVTLPNLPATLPKGFDDLKKKDVDVAPGKYDDQVAQCYRSFNGSTYGGNSPICYAYSPKIKSIGVLAPATSLPPPAALPPPGPCPPVICRTRAAVDMSCVGFKPNATGAPPAVFNGLPYYVMHENRTNADAIVLWNDTKKEAIILWKYTEETRDWLTDAVAYKTDDLVDELEKLFPAAKGLTGMIKNPQVHAGFYHQFASLAIDGVGPDNLTAQLYALSSGQKPRFITISGFSLGGGLSEIAGTWASYMWPAAHVTVATMGAPKVGNSDFVTLFRATAGQSFRYQYNLDIVPYSPPVPGYTTTSNPIWIVGAGGGPIQTILTARPGSRDSTWYDHWCEVFYVPNLYSEGPPARSPPSPSSLGVSVPQYVYFAPAG